MYEPKLLLESTSSEVQLLARKLLEGRTTFLVGAGISMDAPCGLPSSQQLGQWLVTRLSAVMADGAFAGVDATDLLAVADAAAAIEQHGLQLMQSTLVQHEFDRAPPTFGHRVLALLFAERLATVSLSTNFDTCLERSTLSEGVIHACRCAEDMQRGGGKGLWLKIHGCVTREDTMLLTSAQLEKGSEWALAHLTVAVANNAIVLVGVGSLAPYMRTTISKVWAYAKSAESVWIADATIDDRWDELLGVPNDAHKIQARADEFFDELLRGCFRDCWGKLQDTAQRLDEEPGAPQVISAAVAALWEIVGQQDAETVILYLRQCASPDKTPGTTGLGAEGLRALQALAMIQAAMGSKMTVVRGGEWVTIILDDVGIHVAIARNAEPSYLFAQTVRYRLAAAKTLAPPIRRLVILSRGSVGELPNPAAPPNILATLQENDILDGPLAQIDRWLSMDLILQCRDLPTVQRLLTDAVV